MQRRNHRNPPGLAKQVSAPWHRSGSSCHPFSPRSFLRRTDAARFAVASTATTASTAKARSAAARRDNNAAKSDPSVDDPRRATTPAVNYPALRRSRALACIIHPLSFLPPRLICHVAQSASSTIPCIDVAHPCSLAVRRLHPDSHPQCRPQSSPTTRASSRSSR